MLMENIIMKESPKGEKSAVMMKQENALVSMFILKKLQELIQTNFLLLRQKAKTNPFEYRIIYIGIIAIENLLQVRHIKKIQKYVLSSYHQCNVLQRISMPIHKYPTLHSCLNILISALSELILTLKMHYLYNQSFKLSINS